MVSDILFLCFVELGSGVYYIMDVNKKQEEKCVNFLQTNCFHLLRKMF